MRHDLNNRLIEVIIHKIVIIILIIISIANYADNKQQDSLIFKNIDLTKINTEQIKQLGEFDSGQVEVNLNNLKIVSKILMEK